MDCCENGGVRGPGRGGGLGVRMGPIIGVWRDH